MLHNLVTLECFACHAKIVLVVAVLFCRQFVTCSVDGINNGLTSVIESNDLGSTNCLAMLLCLWCLVFAILLQNQLGIHERNQKTC